MRIIPAAILAITLTIFVHSGASAETYAFDTNWGLLTVHSDDGVTFKGTYGKKGGRVYG